jgi:tRNA (cmo5U34)-methyltransferase
MSTTPNPTPVGGWSDVEQVRWYTERIGRLEARQAGERMLAELLPSAAHRVLDLGCGDGRLAQLVIATCDQVDHVVCGDVSAPMLELARARFADDPRVTVVEHDLREPLPEGGPYDVVVTGFAVHHLEDGEKRGLFERVAATLSPGGRFLDLEVVASATPALHAAFLEAIGRTSDDPEDRLAPVEDQLGWMRDAGLVEVDCLWRWRGFALLTGTAPSGEAHQRRG